MDGHLKPVHHSQPLSRRDFLRAAASVGAVGAGAVLLGACGSDDGSSRPTSTPGPAVDPPPETTTIRLAKDPVDASQAPLYVAGLFLPEEGFTNVQYIDVPGFDPGIQQLASGQIDIGRSFASAVTVAADAGDPLVALAGLFNTNFRLFGNDRVQSLRDLKGKRIFVPKRGVTDIAYAFWAVLLAYVGIDIERDVELIELSFIDLPRALQADTIDAVIAPRPYSTLLETRYPGLHVVLDGAKDPPWSQYFGNFVTGNRDFVEKHPAATKRALRAILKAADVCAREPERAARYLVDKGFTPHSVAISTPFTYDQVLDAITGVSYAAWREFDPEDTVRFFALRLREAGLVKSTPDDLIARATDWRYLNEIKRELAV